MDNFLRKTKLGYTVNENAAGHMQSLKYCSVVTPPGQVAGTGQSRGAGADYRDFVSVRRGTGDFAVRVGIIPVGDKSLKVADRYRIGLNSANAVFFTLYFLGTDPAAYGGQRAGLRYHLVSAFIILFAYLFDKARNIDLNGAAVNAWLIFAAEAAVRLG